MLKTQNFIKTNNSESKNPNEVEEKDILVTLVKEFKDVTSAPALEEIEVKDVRIGLAYTGVLLSEGYGGIACTPLYEFSCCPAMDFSETLKGKTAGKILELTLSKNPLEVAVGVATLNALSNMLLDLNLTTFRPQT